MRRISSSVLFFAARHLADCSMRRWRAGDMLAHPKTMPHLNTILGEGWRLDHGPGLIAMDKGCEGGMLVRPLPLLFFFRSPAPTADASRR